MSVLCDRDGCGDRAKFKWEMTPQDRSYTVIITLCLDHHHALMEELDRDDARAKLYHFIGLIGSDSKLQPYPGSNIRREFSPWKPDEV